MDTQFTRRVLAIRVGDAEVGEELENLGYDVNHVNDIGGALHWMSKNGRPHAMVIDIAGDVMDMIPDLSELAQTGVPIVGATTERNVDEEVELLDHLEVIVTKKPGYGRVLAKQIWRILSWMGNVSHATGPETEVYAGIIARFADKQVLVGETVKSLTGTENKALYQLYLHRGTTVEAQTLIERVWKHNDPTRPTDRNALRVHIHRLRNKIEKDPDNPLVILTSRGIGYGMPDENGMLDGIKVA
jgi:DNA-binding response OmpR family regulator